MQKTRLDECFLDYVEGLDEPRGKRNRLYTMAEILLTTLCAVICGADGWQNVEDNGKIKLDCLRQFLPYKKGIPGGDTFRQFCRALDPTTFYVSAII